MPYAALTGVPVPPEGLNPNTYGSLAGGAFAEQIFTPYDFYTPQELTDLYYNHKRRSPGLAMILRNSGMSRGVKSPNTGHYEKPWHRDHLVIGSTDAAGGLTATITLAAASMFTVTGTTIRGSYPIDGEVYELPNRKQFRISAKDTTANPHTVLATSIDITVNLDAADFVANQRVMHVNNAQAEGAQLPGGKVPRIMKYTNTFQILATSIASTGSDLTNKTYFNVLRNEDGAPTGSYFAVGLEDSVFNHEEDKDNAILFGRQIGGITETTPFLGYPTDVRGTEGLIEFGLTAGYDEDWDPATGYDMQDFDDIFAIYEKERVSYELMCSQGFNIFQSIENLLVDYVKQTEVSFTPTMGAESVFTVKVDFYGIKKSGYDVTFRKEEAFNSVKGGATTGYDYPNWQIFTPWGLGTDMKTGDKVGFLGYEWKQLDSYSRENVMIKLDGTGATSQLASFSDDIFQCGYRSEIAAHFACANAIVIQRPV